MKLLVVWIHLVSVFAWAGVSKVEGKWEGKAYSFTLDSEQRRAVGDWGDRKYDLSVDALRKRVWGTVEDKKVDFEYEERWRELTGTLPCGRVQLYVYTRVMEVTGKVCDEKVSEIIDKKPNLMPRLYEIALTPATQRMPLLAAERVREFLRDLLL